MKAIVTGVTLSGNLGGYAMLLAIKDVLSIACQDLSLASILPKQDKKITNQNFIHIISADYRVWILLTTPLCLLLWPFRKSKLAHFIAKNTPILKDFAKMDLVIDLSGVAFVDGRGFSLLIYNIAIVLPGLFFDKPVYKLSQALGPFQNTINKISAKWVLNRCKKVVARGRKSLKYLNDINIKNSVYYPDTSFALSISEETKIEARNIVLNNIPTRAKNKLVIISPSAVVKNYYEKAGLDLVDEFCKTIHELNNQGITCALLAHSTHTGIAKNDDVSVIKSIEIKIRRKYGKIIPILDAKGDPRIARAIIGNADVFIACRFHALIAALSQAIPVVTIGWSHKYLEAAAPFSMERYTMDYKNISKGILVKYVNELISNRISIVKKMKISAKYSKKKATDGIKIILKKFDDDK